MVVDCTDFAVVVQKFLKMIMISFLFQTIIISLTGVMAPGAVTAATLAQGSRHRWAGVWIAIGHGIVEIPLIFLLILGLGTVLKTDTAQIIIGIIGGAFLVYLGIMTLREPVSADPNAKKSRTGGPMLTGFVLSATNPYFLFWWATVGLNLAIKAQMIGAYAIVIFAIVHWICDLIWLTILSFTAFHGTNILSHKVQKYILAFCGAAMAAFGLKFLHDAITLLL
jgi:threonine/homoserine/homoserine lactone efflux protein